jgi:hypothetical protein
LASIHLNPELTEAYAKPSVILTTHAPRTESLSSRICEAFGSFADLLLCFARASESNIRHLCRVASHASGNHAKSIHRQKRQPFSLEIQNLVDPAILRVDATQ